MEVRSFSDLLVKLIICSLNEENTEINVSEKSEVIKKIVKEVKDIVENKFAGESDEFILNNFLEEHEKYAFNFEETLHDKLENDENFRSKLE